MKNIYITLLIMISVVFVTAYPMQNEKKSDVDIKKVSVKPFNWVKDTEWGISPTDIPLVDGRLMPGLARYAPYGMRKQPERYRAFFIEQPCDNSCDHAVVCVAIVPYGNKKQT